MLLANLLVGAFCTGALVEGSQILRDRQSRPKHLCSKHHTQKISTRRTNTNLASPVKTRKNFKKILHTQHIAIRKNSQDQILSKKLKTLTIPLVMVPVGGFLNLPAVTGFGLGVYLYTALPIVIKDLYNALIKEKRLSMVALECVLFTLMLSTGHYLAAVLGAFLYFLSRKLVLKTENHSRANLVDSYSKQQKIAWQKIGNSIIETPIEKLNQGDIIIVSAGEIIPVDGTVLTGIASVDQSSLTGESQPVDCEEKSKIFASTVVLTGYIEVTVEKAGHETIASQINQILLNTADFTSSMHSRGEYIADRTALPTLVAGGLSYMAGFTPIRSASLMNANFGYNMRILAPISMLRHLSFAAKQGILIKDGRALELVEEVDTVVFDKTGTLTTEIPTLAEVHLFGDLSAAELLRYAATAEQRQQHPIAQAIIAAAKAEGNSILSPIDDAAYRIGYGLTVQFQGKTIQLGSRRFMELESVALTNKLHSLFAECEKKGVTLVMMAIDGILVGAFELHATIRPEASKIIEKLRQKGVKYIYILTGDHQSAAQYIAQQLNIDGFFADILPQDKSEHIKQLQKMGRKVCYIGDGINDAIALKQAHVSVSLAGASTVATDTAAIVLMDGNLKRLPLIFDLANNFSTSIQHCFYTTIVPGVICVIGVVGFKFSIITTILLNQTGLLSGLATTHLKRNLPSKRKYIP